VGVGSGEAVGVPQAAVGAAGQQQPHGGPVPAVRRPVERRAPACGGGRASERERAGSQPALHIAGVISFPLIAGLESFWVFSSCDAAEFILVALKSRGENFLIWKIRYFIARYCVILHPKESRREKRKSGNGPGASVAQELTMGQKKTHTKNLSN